VTETAGLSSSVYAIWWAALAVVVIVIVPLAVYLLDRTLRAARAIQTYIAEMLVAGLGVAGNTEAISALNDTTATAVTMIGAAEQLKGHSSALVAILGQRAQRDAVR
jgi:hypothetical protein